jgi:hypothetical protein
MDAYAVHLAAAGLEVTRSEVLNKHCAKTWDFCLDIIKDKTLWALAVQNGPDFVRFLRAFKDMRAAFASGNFVYGLMVAKRSGRSLDPCFS